MSSEHVFGCLVIFAALKNSQFPYLLEIEYTVSKHTGSTMSMFGAKKVPKEPQAVVAPAIPSSAPLPTSASNATLESQREAVVLLNDAVASDPAKKWASKLTSAKNFERLEWQRKIIIALAHAQVWGVPVPEKLKDFIGDNDARKKMMNNTYLPAAQAEHDAILAAEKASDGGTTPRGLKPEAPRAPSPAFSDASIGHADSDEETPRNTRPEQLQGTDDNKVTSGGRLSPASTLPLEEEEEDEPAAQADEDDINPAVEHAHDQVEFIIEEGRKVVDNTPTPPRDPGENASWWREVVEAKAYADVWELDLPKELESIAIPKERQIMYDLRHDQIVKERDDFYDHPTDNWTPSVPTTGPPLLAPITLPSNSSNSSVSSSGSGYDFTTYPVDVLVSEADLKAAAIAPGTENTSKTKVASRKPFLKMLAVWKRQQIIRNPDIPDPGLPEEIDKLFSKTGRYKGYKGEYTKAYKALDAEHPVRITHPVESLQLAITEQLFQVPNSESLADQIKASALPPPKSTDITAAKQQVIDAAIEQKKADDATAKAQQEAAEKAALAKAQQEATEKAALAKAQQEAAEKAALAKAQQEATEKAALAKAQQEAAEKAAKEKQQQIEAAAKKQRKEEEEKKQRQTEPPPPLVVDQAPVSTDQPGKTPAARAPVTRVPAATPLPPPVAHPSATTTPPVVDQGNAALGAPPQMLPAASTALYSTLAPPPPTNTAAATAKAATPPASKPTPSTPAAKPTPAPVAPPPTEKPVVNALLHVTPANSGVREAALTNAGAAFTPTHVAKQVVVLIEKNKKLEDEISKLKLDAKQKQVLVNMTVPDKDKDLALLFTTNISTLHALSMVLFNNTTQKSQDKGSVNHPYDRTGLSCFYALAHTMCMVKAIDMDSVYINCAGPKASGKLGNAYWRQVSPQGALQMPSFEADFLFIQLNNANEVATVMRHLRPQANAHLYVFFCVFTDDDVKQQKAAMPQPNSYNSNPNLHVNTNIFDTRNPKHRATIEFIAGEFREEVFNIINAKSPNPKLKDLVTIRPDGTQP